MDPPPETTDRSFVYNRIPTKVARKDFNRYIAPYLQRPKKGPKPQLSLYKIFNYILSVLPTGIQWHQRKTHQNELHCTNVYTWHNRWSKDGSYQALFEASVIHLHGTEQLDTSVLHGDGSNTVVKKGARASATPARNIRKGTKSWRSWTITASSAVPSRSNSSTNTTPCFSQKP
jgi:hypothetical protein